MQGNTFKQSKVLDKGLVMVLLVASADNQLKETKFFRIARLTHHRHKSCGYLFTLSLVRSHYCEGKRVYPGLKIDAPLPGRFRRGQYQVSSIPLPGEGAGK